MNTNSNEQSLPWWLTEKAPYFLSILVAAIAWTIVRTADRLISLPIVEYSVKESNNVRSLRLRNITNDKMFECISLFLAVKGQDGKLRDFRTSEDAPYTVRGNTLFDFAPQSGQSTFGKSPQQLSLTLSNFAPGSDFEIKLSLDGGQGDLRVLAEQCTKPAKDEAEKLATSSVMTQGKKANPEADSGKGTGTPLILMQSSWKTFFVRNELETLWGCIGAWVVLIALARFGAYRSRKKSATNAAHEDDDSG